MRMVGHTLACLLGTAPLALAQPRPMAFERVSLEQGLSQSTVLSMIQDSRGFMWFGTEDGLNRYDGINFKSYKSDPSDHASLPASMVWAVTEDAQGDLWLATEGGGLARWDRTHDRFTRVPVSSTPGLYGRIRTLLFAPDGALWMGSKDAGLLRFEPATGAVKAFRHDPADASSLSHDGVYALASDGAGRLWVGTDGGLNRLDPATGRFERFRHDPARPESLGDDRVRALLVDRERRLWIGTFGGGLSRLDAGSNAFRTYRNDPANATSLGHDRVRALLEDGGGRLWIATDRGLDLLDRQHATFEHHRNDSTDPSSLGDDTVMSLYQDRGGVLWVGTRTGGAYKWNPATWSFGHHTRSSASPGGLADKTVTSFAEDRVGRIWIGTFGGLHVMDRQTGDVTRYVSKAGPIGERVMALATDADGMLWIGTMDAGLIRLDPGTGTLRSYRHDAGSRGSLSADAVMSLLVDSVGDLWVGTFGGGLNRFDAATGAFTRYRNDPANEHSLSADAVTALAQDASGGLWLGTDGGGLNLLDRTTGQFTRFLHDPGNASSLGANTVYALYLDSAGRLWVGTRGGGLAVMESREGAEARFRHVRQRDGLANDVIYGVVPDGEGHLWLSTNNGLTRYEPATGKSKNYDTSHGLQSNEYNFGAHFRSASGELFFGGVNGFNAFHPRKLVANTHVPPVVLTSFLKFNRPVDTAGPLWMLKGIDLGYGDDVVTFEFAALDYAAPERNRFVYKLEGFDPDWVDLGNVRRVTYTNLAAGNYRLRVKGANNDGVWNESGIDVPVRVEAPPWLRWWAFVAYALALGGALYLFVRVQQAKVEREAEYARRLEEDVQNRTLELEARNSDLEDLNRKLAEASLTDSLTGLRNRRFLFEYVSKDADLVRRRYIAIKQGDEARTFDLSFVMIDLDHFKAINDTCGHAAGDAVLLGVRAVLEKTCRTSDVLIRWGGDEFLLVGRDNDPDQVGTLAERIRAEIESTTFDIGEGRVARITCSVGYACYPFVRTEPELYAWEDMLGLADAALYAAKGLRNAWVGFLSTAQAPPRDLARSARIEPQRL
ncbi:MAG TPA: two-component regulator propeller domain-containing protein, partial [Vicinamibacteria bacterium]|nr:two-component regulator propeller domain-containing protein [Vicinamibacteria bacterium]